MRFDAERRTLESGAHANVCDRAASARFAFEKRARDVNAAGGEQFLFRREIQCWKGEAPARASSGDDFTAEHERAAKKASCVRNVARSNFAADDGAGHDFVFAVDVRDDDDVEAALGAEQKEHSGVASLFVAEAEIFSDKNGAHFKIGRASCRERVCT